MAARVVSRTVAIGSDVREVAEMEIFGLEATRGRDITGSRGVSLDEDNSCYDRGR